MYMDNIPMDLNESDDSSVSDSTEESMQKSLLSLSSSQIYTEPFTSLDSIFLPAWYDRHSFIREANFRFFTPRCMLPPTARLFPYYFIKAIDHSFYGFTGEVNHLWCWENIWKACKSLA